MVHKIANGLLKPVTKLRVKIEAPENFRTRVLKQIVVTHLEKKSWQMEPRL